MAEPPRLGWKGVRPDYRDEPYRFKNALKAELATPAELPPSSRPQWREVEAMPILDQGLSSACTGYGTAPMAAVERNVTMRSPDAIYRAARAAIGELDRDEGAYGHDAVAYAVQEGAPAHRLWPSKLGADGKPIHLWEAPSARALADAAKRKLFTYHGLATGQEFRSCLQRHTFAIGISCYDNLFDPLTERFGIVQMPAGDYQGGTKQGAKGEFLTGATHINGGLHTWLSMEVSSPAATYNPNAGGGAGSVQVYDYTATISIAAGATIRMKAFDIDCLMHRYCQNDDYKNCKGYVLPPISPADSPIDGSFLQMTVMSVTPM